MRPLIIIWTLLAFVSGVLAQETPSLRVTVVTTTPAMSQEIFLLPEPITADTLRAILTQTRLGVHEPMQVIQSIIARGSPIVPVLEQLIYSDSSFENPTTNLGTDDNLPARSSEADGYLSLYAISSLDGIGTQECYDILMHIVHSCSNPIVQGASLIALSEGYRHRAINGTLEPDREVVHLFLQCVDDEQMVPSFERCIGRIARDGFRAWTGMDLGESFEDSLQVLVDTTKVKMSTPEYREYWWTNQLHDMAWRMEEGRFACTR